jgi:hypothetical protein
MKFFSFDNKKIKMTVSNFINYAITCGIDIKVFDDEEKDQSYIDKNILEGWLYLDAVKDFIFERTDHHKIGGYPDEYVKIEAVIDMMSHIFRHPIHYNFQLAIKGALRFDDYVIDKELLKNYTKKEETYVLAAIYAKYSKQFRIFNTFHILGGTYKTDGVLYLLRENIPGMYPSEDDKNKDDIYPGGVILEHDENDHERYDPDDEIDRHNIIKTHRYSLVRSKTGDSFERLCIKIDAAQIEQQMIYTSNVDPEKIWDQLQKHSIEKDFFSIFKKCMNPDEKYCISSKELSTYIGMRHNHLKDRHITKLSSEKSEFKNEFSDRVGTTTKDVQSCNTRVGSKIGHGGSNIKLMYMSVKGMQLVLMSLRNNAKATKAQLSLVICYQIAFKVAIALKNQVTSMIAKTKEEAHESVVGINNKSFKKHRIEKSKTKIISQKRDDEIKVMIEKISILKKEQDEYKKTIEEITENNNKLLEKNELLNKKLSSSTNRKTKYMNKYRTAQTELEQAIKDKEKVMNKYDKYVKKSTDKPDVQMYIDKCKKYSQQIKNRDIIVTKYKNDINDITIKYNTLIKKYNKLVEKQKTIPNINITVKDPIYSDKPIKKVDKNIKEKVDEKVDEKVGEKVEEKVDENVEEKVNQYTIKKLKGNSVSDLKIICRHKGISGYSKFCKSDLIKYMFESVKLNS